MLDLHTLRCTFPIWPAGRTSVCKSACTLNKVQAVIVSPVFDILFPDQIKRADQFHALKVLAVKFWHHRLDLCSVKHTHEDCLDHIIIMMSECDLIASKLLCKMIQMSSSHSCTQITWRLLNRKHRFKYIRFKYRNRDIQTFCIFFYNLPVRLTVTGIHNQKLNFKFKFVMQLQFLKTFRHQHRILTTGNADRDLISRLHQLICVDRLGEL